MKQYLFIIAGIAVLVLLYLGFGAKAEFFETANPQPFSTNINVVDVQGVGAWVINGETKLCPGCNNPGVVSNYYSKDGDSLILKSSGSGENGIIVNGTFPKGVVKVTCDLSASTSENMESQTYCFTKRVSSAVLTATARDKGSAKEIQSFTINTDNTDLSIGIWGNPKTYGYYNSKVTIEFIPELSDEIDVPISAIPATEQETSTEYSNGTENQNDTEPSWFQKIINWIKGVLGI